MLPNGESRYRGNAVQRILELTGQSPYYIQLFCQRLVEYMNSDEVRGLKQRMPRAIYSVNAREVSCRLDPVEGADRVSMRQGLELLAAILDQRRARAA